MGKFIDLTGRRFGRLTVIRRNGTAVRGIKTMIKAPTWECLCDCGNIVTVVGAELRSGDTVSCGCIHRALIENLSKSHGDGTRSSKYYRLYRIWYGMKERCGNPSEKAYVYYGERGISVCDEWKNYEAFKAWALSHGYKEDLTIDRIDNDLGYFPGNCRWVDYTVQANNRRSCRYVEMNGERKTITEWCRIYNINYDTVMSRIDRLHWHPTIAITTPPTRKKVCV